MGENQGGKPIVATPSLMDATRIWLKVGLLSFGGPAAQIALMHRLLVEEMRWLSEKQYLNALSFCMLLPGPEAMQLATYAGWRLHGVVGGLIAGLLFVLPGAVVILSLALVYAVLGDISLVNALFLGIKAAVLIIVLEALFRVARKSLNGPIFWWIAALAFIGIFFFALPYPLIVVLAAGVGFIKGAKTDGASTDVGQLRGTLPKTFLTILIWLALWALPLFLVSYWVDHPILNDVGVFFSRLAVVTFGGAYAVLAYMGQEVVSQFGWLTAGEMMDGLGLAETTPGPLILVTEFVGFIAAYREGGMGLGLAGAAITLWVTFVPCFLWIFAGAPYIEWICHQPRLKGALSAISAAVVGVILNLSIWFALHVIFSELTLQKHGPLHLWRPDFASIDWRVVGLSLICGLAIFKYHWSILKTLALSAGIGIVLAYFI
ncbi:MAG: chromate efflux transporter [Gammaproteobacteria bacterium]|nr:chromate efflux transporter [Gammaproteobacteria bacterium]